MAIFGLGSSLLRGGWAFPEYSSIDQIDTINYPNLGKSFLNLEHQNTRGCQSKNSIVELIIYDQISIKRDWSKLIKDLHFSWLVTFDRFD